MKQKYWLFLFMALIVAACSKDDDLDFLLAYDGDNFSAPQLNTGFHEFAALFPASETAEYDGQQLIEVTWFTAPTLPVSAEVKIYGPGTNNTPGTLLYSANVSNGLRAQDWATHALATPVDINGQDLWISLRVEHSTNQQSIGCDAGPNVTNGDWLFTDGSWTTFTNLTGESVNWNIRGVVSQN